MNANEIVKRLREYAKHCDGVHSCWNDTTLLAAADLIESLQADHESSQQVKKSLQREGYSDIETMISQYKQVMIAANEHDLDRDEEVERLEAQLSASQRREKAAVEDIHTVYSNGLCEVCGRRDTCLMTLDRGEDGTVCRGIKFEWRGPQEAGEGGTP